MKGSRGACQHCKSRELEIRQEACYVVECASCGAVLEEWALEAIELPVVTQTARALPAISPDLLQEYEFHDELLGDPFCAEPVSGFVSGFAPISLDKMLVSAEIARSFSGEFAEFERVVASRMTALMEDSELMPTTVFLFSIYFELLALCTQLDLPRELLLNCFESVQTVELAGLKQVSALAAAAIWSRARVTELTLAELCDASGVPGKEVVFCMNQYIANGDGGTPNSPSVPSPAVRVASFCAALGLKEPIPSLASHIAVRSCQFSTRRHPVSVSAAAVYMACRLQRVEKRQREIVEVAHSTEVTLRKVYKELLENLEEMLPPGYTPLRPVSELHSRVGKNIRRPVVLPGASGAPQTLTAGHQQMLPVSFPDLGVIKGPGGIQKARAGLPASFALGARTSFTPFVSMPIRPGGAAAPAPFIPGLRGVPSMAVAQQLQSRGIMPTGQRLVPLLPQGHFVRTQSLSSMPRTLGHVPQSASRPSAGRSSSSPAGRPTDADVGKGVSGHAEARKAVKAVEKPTAGAAAADQKAS